MEPGEVIKQLRVDRGLNQREAAALTEGRLTQAAWSRVESGMVADSRPSTKQAIAWALGCSASDIWPARRRKRGDAAERPNSVNYYHPDNDPDTPDARGLGKHVIAYIDFAHDCFGYLDRKRTPPVPTRRAVRARSRERRDSTRRGSSCGSPSGDSDPDEPEPAEGRSQERVEQVRALLRNHYSADDEAYAHAVEVATVLDEAGALGDWRPSKRLRAVGDVR